MTVLGQSPNYRVLAMPALIYSDETPQTFKEIAEYLRIAAARLDAFGDALERQNIDSVSVPLKASVLDALTAIEKWTAASQAAYLEHKKGSGAIGPDPKGKGPRAGKPSPGSGNFRGKKASKK